MGFLVGRRMGADLLLRYGGRRANSLSAWLGRHGILASALMRILPTGPFVMVNLVAGVSRITFTQFLIGSTLGTIPKAGLMAYLGASLFEFLSSRDPRDLLLLALGVAVWFAVMAVVRRLMARRIGTPEPPSEMESRGTGREHAADPAAALEDAQRRGAADPSRRD